MVATFCLQEEIMTMERILLQTIKFDLMVEHPYVYLLKFARILKGNFGKHAKYLDKEARKVEDEFY